MKREGWEINDLSPLSWQSFWDFTTSGLFSKVFLRVLKRILFRENSNIPIWCHEMFVFSESCLSQKTFLLQKIDCVFVLAIRGLLHMIKNFFCVVVWFCVFNHFYGIFFFWKVSFETTLSWCCRKHVFVFEIASLKKKFEWVYDQIIFFPVTFGWKDLSSPLWTKFWKLFRFGRWLSLFVLES